MLRVSLVRTSTRSGVTPDRCGSNRNIVEGNSHAGYFRRSEIGGSFSVRIGHGADTLLCMHQGESPFAVDTAGGRRRQVRSVGMTRIRGGLCKPRGGQWLARSCAFAVSAGLSILAGCASTWRPPLEGVQAATASMTVVLGQRAAPAGALYTYRRTFPGRRDLPADEYDVRFSATQRGEGRLASCHVRL